MRLLYSGHAHGFLRSAEKDKKSDRGTNQAGHLRKPLPLYRLPQYCRSDKERGRKPAGKRIGIGQAGAESKGISMVSILKDIPIEGVEIIPCRLNGPRGIVKSFLICGDQRLVLVDTGFSDADAGLIMNRIDAIG